MRNVTCFRLIVLIHIRKHLHQMFVWFLYAFHKFLCLFLLTVDWRFCFKETHFLRVNITYSQNVTSIYRICVAGERNLLLRIRITRYMDDIISSVEGYLHTINAFTIFPELEGLCSFLQWKYFDWHQAFATIPKMLLIIVMFW